MPRRATRIATYACCRKWGLDETRRTRIAAIITPSNTVDEVVDVDVAVVVIHITVDIVVVIIHVTAVAIAVVIATSISIHIPVP